MIEISSFMWTLAIFFAVLGFMRGWVKELVVTAALMLGLFAIFQFDGILRGTVFLALPRTQIFLLESAFYIAIAVIAYQVEDIDGATTRDEDDWQSGILGTIVGFVNGYLIGGAIWYFLDINEYPFEQFVTAPGLASPSAQSLNTMPIVLLGGGASGTGDFLAVAVIGLLLIVLIVV